MGESEQDGTASLLSFDPPKMQPSGLQLNASHSTGLAAQLTALGDHVSRAFTEVLIMTFPGIAPPVPRFFAW